MSSATAVVWNVRAIEGSAVTRIVPSSISMNSAPVTRLIIRRRRSGESGAGAAGMEAVWAGCGGKRGYPSIGWRIRFGKGWAVCPACTGKPG
jgi:hypothetical protein